MIGGAGAVDEYGDGDWGLFVPQSFPAIYGVSRSIILVGIEVPS